MRVELRERINQIRKQLECLLQEEAAVRMEENQDKAPVTSKVRVQYFVVEVSQNGEAAVLKFPQSQHAEQVLRGLVHSGHKTSIEEVTEIKNLLPEEIEDLQIKGYNLCFIPNDYNEKRAYREEIANCVPTPTLTGRY